MEIHQKINSWDELNWGNRMRRNIAHSRVQQEWKVKHVRKKKMREKVKRGEKSWLRGLRCMKGVFSQACICMSVKVNTCQRQVEGVCWGVCLCVCIRRFMAVVQYLSSDPVNLSIPLRQAVTTSVHKLSLSHTHPSFAIFESNGHTHRVSQVQFKPGKIYKCRWWCCGE